MKKLLIVVICVVTVSSLFGINNRLDHDGLVHAGEMVGSEVEQILVDVEGFRLIFSMLRVYDPTKDQSELGWSINSEGDQYKYTIWIGEQGFQEDETKYAESVLFTNLDPTTPSFQAVWDVARRFEHEPQNEVLGWLITGVTYVTAVISAIVTIAIDVITTAFSVVNAGFYLFGL